MKYLWSEVSLPWLEIVPTMGGGFLNGSDAYDCRCSIFIFQLHCYHNCKFIEQIVKFRYKKYGCHIWIIDNNDFILPKLL